MGQIIELPKKKKRIIEANQIVWGDCLDWLDFVEKGTVDVCYIDPPFFSNKKYEIIWGNGYELRSFGDRWKGGIEVYIKWMQERVIKIHEALKPTGSIFLHCDWRASHRLRFMLDEVFGKENFVNEIIWSYKTGGVSKNWFGRKHDNIYFYSKNGTPTFNLQKEKSYLPHKYGFKNIKIKKDNIGYYRDVYMRDVFDIPALRGNQPETIEYNTQKPEKLLERIIKASTNEGDLVLDCFGGGGTTAAVASKLNREFIIGDVSPVACRVIAYRLNQRVDPKPDYDFFNIPKSKKEWLAIDGHTFAERICEFMGWKCNPKKSNDQGIKGWAENKKGQKIPIQIKNQEKAISRADIQKFVGAMSHSKEGLFVSWDFSKPAEEYLIKEAEKQYKKEIRFIKVGDEILQDILVEDTKINEWENSCQKIISKQWQKEEQTQIKRIKKKHSKDKSQK